MPIIDYGTRSFDAKRPHAPPRRQRRSRRTSRRGVRRRFKRASRNSANIRKMPILMPDRLRVPLKYTERLVATATTGAIVTNVWRGNSCFDLDFTGTGVQPVGFDQWSAFYGSYIVYASKMIVTAMPVSGSITNTTFEMILYPSLATTAITDMDTAMSQRYSKHYFGNLYIGHMSIVNFMTTSKIEGELPTVPFTEDNYQAATTQNPTNQWYWQWAIQPTDRATTSVYDVFFNITSFVEFNNALNLALS